MDLKEGDLEFCFGPEKGVLGIDALPHPNPKVHTTFAVFAQFLGLSRISFCNCTFFRRFGTVRL